MRLGQPRRHRERFDKSKRLDVHVWRDDITYPRDILGVAGLVVVHVDPLQLEVGVAGVRAGGVDTMLITGGGSGLEIKTRHSRFTEERLSYLFHEF